MIAVKVCGECLILQKLKENTRSTETDSNDAERIYYVLLA